MLIFFLSRLAEGKHNVLMINCQKDKKIVLMTCYVFVLLLENYKFLVYVSRKSIFLLLRLMSAREIHAVLIKCKIQVITGGIRFYHVQKY